MSVGHLSVRGLRKAYRGAGGETLALDHVDITVEPGAFATVLGPSGSGKTTLFGASPDSRPRRGTISLGDRVLAAPAGWFRRTTGDRIVPQEGALFPHLSVARNIAFGIIEQPREKRRARVNELLELVGLQGMHERRPHQLSGGQQQRSRWPARWRPNPSWSCWTNPSARWTPSCGSSCARRCANCCGG